MTATATKTRRVRRDKTLPTVDEVVSNLRQHRENATAEQVHEGRGWYSDAGKRIAGIAADAFEHTGEFVSFEFACGVVAAYSQNSTWKANITMATRYLHGRVQGGLEDVLAEIERMENGESPATAIGALKRPDFWRNLTGIDPTAVTCDRHHLRASFRLADYCADDLANVPGYIGRKRDRTTGVWTLAVELTPEVHALVTEATRILAAEFGESPMECQAVIWCVIRGDGK